MGRPLRFEPLEDRTTPAGGLDPTFGGGDGVFAAAPGGLTAGGAQVEVQADGKILVTGGSGDQGVVARFHPDGSPDLAFGTGGRAAYGPGSAVGMGVAADGRIYVAVTDYSPVKAGVYRLLPDGAVDPTYGAGGYAAVDFVTADGPFGQPIAYPAEAHAMTVRPDGTAVVAGYGFGPDGQLLGAVQLTPAGAPDPAFSGDGRFTYVAPRDGASEPPTPSVAGVAEAPDGGVVILAGFYRFDYAAGPGGHSRYSVSALRLTPAGELDPGFSGDGVWDAGEDGAAPLTTGLAVAVQPDGKVVLLGSAAGSLTAARLNPDGSADAAFGAGGQVPDLMPGTHSNYHEPGALAVLPDGRIVAASETVEVYSPGGPGWGPWQHTGVRLGVAVLNPDGTFDDYFADGSGQASVAFEPRPPGTWGPDNPGGLPDYSAEAGVGDVAVAGGRVVAAVALREAGPRAYSDRLPVRLGLAVLAERDDALPPDHLAPPPAESPVLPVPEDGEPDSAPPMAMAGEPVPPPPEAEPAPSLPAPLPGPSAQAPAANPGPPTGGYFEPEFGGPVAVVDADLTGDGVADRVAAAGEGGGARVRVFDGVTGAVLADLLGIQDPDFRGGARVAVGDVTGDGVPDLVVAAGTGGGPRVTVWDGASVLAGTPAAVADFFAFDPSLRDGAYPAAGDVTGDGVADLAFGAGPGGAPRARVVDGKGLLAAGPVPSLDAAPAARVADFFAGDPESRAGVRVALDDADGDGRADLRTAAGAGDPARVYSPAVLTLAGPDLDLAADPGGPFVG